ncbi:Avr9 [Fulvia fulva]|uniref:Race-specific elicitor A9 n=2 Tax=Passalora fulva TaxID=5499 RepID=AVR9_PASFU|nr:Avr9 [Fulvia fulva]P22287.1 RecName: Full=Race-specific elicitor A9; Flags: Precursor [Fulvia fulva]AAA03344.1 race-specific elicitor A9 [Fulvia fulva]AGD98918.1 AVR9 protein [Fulvia fulva]AGD98919.1 AVR9 protein [Fulvia fulva]AGD98920.1 AVR9 protein [Fulvia fulva]AGD98921.1 AVR9 protein [Fulvia fulva]
MKLSLLSVELALLIATTLPLCWAAALPVGLGVGLDYCNSSCTRAFDCLGQCGRCDFHKLQCVH